MKITIEIGPNKVTRFLSRCRNAVKGLKTGWKEFSGKPASPVKAAKAA